MPPTKAGFPEMERKYGLADRARKPYGTSAVSDCSVAPSTHGLDKHGLGNLRTENWNLPTAALYEHAIVRGEGRMVHLGPLVVRTGKHTGRAANDKFFVDEENSRDQIDWGEVNRPISEKNFAGLHWKAMAYLQNRDVYVSDMYAGADPRYRMRCRVITETAWHALFVRAMLIRPSDEELRTHDPEFTIIHVPGLFADPATDGTRSSTFIVADMGKRFAIIGGTHYAGEIKKMMFTVMNYFLPQRGVLTMHSAANVGSDNRSAIFFGLSGTGKTTLSADSERQLIGDDEHGWSDDGIFNIEGGCYAKLIGLNPTAEPEIWNTTRQYGTVIENVVMNPVTRQLDLTDRSLTENTRAAYPIHYINNFKRGSQGGHPSDIVMLTCDAFGVLPPVSRLTPEQAVFWFLLGYTAKVAGTELGVTEPTATFSPCFGLPFMPLNPTVYGKLLREKVKQHGVQVWLLNTGWSGGKYGVGKRMSIGHTRTMLHAALDGHLDAVKYQTHPVFKLSVPTTCADVPDEVLNPRTAWGADNGAAYDKQAGELATLCREAFVPFASKVSEDVVACSP